MVILGSISGIVTGLALGIFGSGGGIVVVPALIYLLHLPPKEAIAMGLGIATITALLSAWDHWRLGNVDLRAAAIFAPLGVAGTYAGARLGTVMPASWQLGLFVAVMCLAFHMLLGRQQEPQQSGEAQRSPWRRAALLVCFRPDQRGRV